LLTTLQKLKKGEKINDLELPDAITPDYICDCTRKERVESYMKILKDFHARKKEASQKFDQMNDKFSKLPKREFTKNVFLFFKLL